MIRPATKKDAEKLCAIYNHFVRNSVATFEEEDVSSQDMAQRITEVTSAFPWLLFEADGSIIVLWKDFTFGSSGGTLFGGSVGSYEWTGIRHVHSVLSYFLGEWVGGAS